MNYVRSKVHERGCLPYDLPLIPIPWLSVLVLPYLRTESCVEYRNIRMNRAEVLEQRSPPPPPSFQGQYDRRAETL